jgi:FkbM family methyltransferase
MPLLQSLKNSFSMFLYKYWPNKHQIEVKRYFQDGGDEKFRYNFNLNNNSIVFDLGGYKGQWASDIYSKYNCNILIFEPVVAYHNYIENRFLNNPKIIPYNYGLGSVECVLKIGINDDGSSVFIKNDNIQYINIISVGDFFKKQKIEKVDLMKINIEGGEYELLNKIIDLGLINYISNIHVQFHHFIPNAEFELERLYSKLSLTHRPVYKYRFVWETWQLK